MRQESLPKQELADKFNSISTISKDLTILSERGCSIANSMSKLNVLHEEQKEIERKYGT